MTSSRQNQINFIAKRNKVNMETSVEQFSWTSEILKSFKTSDNAKYDYAKMLRNIAFECIKMASEYELESDGLELFPDVLTTLRRTAQIRKMISEHQDIIEDEEFDVITSSHTVERVLRDNFGVELDFYDYYKGCEDICNSYDEDNLCWIKFEIPVKMDGETVCYTIRVGMYLLQTEAIMGVIRSLIVTDNNGEHHLFEKEFEYANRKLV